MSAALQKVAGGVELKIRLTPKSARDDIGSVETFACPGGRDETALKVFVRALPTKGAANEAAAKLIAKWLGVPKTSLSLIRGGKGRLKVFYIEGEAGELAARFSTLVA
jgi:uncharacterized protein YggU (UPF0235/DUF167 family)